MQPLAEKVPPEVNGKETDNINCTDSIRPAESDSAAKEDTEVSSSEGEDGDGDHSPDENQLVVYDPLKNGAGEIVHAAEPLNSRPPASSRKYPSLPVVGAFTVQCANCFQWRLIPSKEKYEEIREIFIEKPFYCESASEWRPGVSCNDPGDIQQDNTRLWAIDKPSIPCPPPGWQRLLRIRGEGSLRFADVYYEAPSGKRFRSLIEIQKYLSEIPELAAGISMSQFSFLIPKPLQEDYVKKKRPSGMKSSRLLDSDEVWVSSPGRPDGLHSALPEPSPSSFESPVLNSADQPPKKRAKMPSTKDNVPSP